IETLHEINIEGRLDAKKSGIERFRMMPAVGDSHLFISCLKDLVLSAVAEKAPTEALSATVGTLKFFCLLRYTFRFMSRSMTTTYKPVLHRYAVFVFLWTILLFIAGALVTSKDAALSVPDWPKTFGTWFPSLRQLVGGSFFEHSHRVIADVLK